MTQPGHHHGDQDFPAGRRESDGPHARETRDRLVDELLTLTSLYCDEQLTAEHSARLQSLLKSDRRMIGLFVEMAQVHGQMAWDAGHAVTSSAQHLADPATNDSETCERSESSRTDFLRPAVETERFPDLERLVEGERRFAVRSASSPSATRMHARPKTYRTSRHVTTVCGVAMVLIAALTGGLWWQNRFRAPQSSSVENENGSPQNDAGNSAVAANDQSSSVSLDGASLPPLELDALKTNARKPPDSFASSDQPGSTMPDTSVSRDRENGRSRSVETLSDDAVVQRIDELLRLAWQENGVQPATVADDSEWARRAFIAFTGSIPTLIETTAFNAAASERRRTALVASLADDHRTADNLSVMWLNLLIGRSNPRGVDEDSLFRFLRDQFTDNRPWIETVGRLVSASGRSDTNGETNYLLAHLNDQATPATAVTARLFLGEQLHCVQCHDHPFAKDVGQDVFWTLNAFFKQTSRRLVANAASSVNAANTSSAGNSNATTTKNESSGTPSGPPRRVWELRDSDKGGMTFYENRRGQQMAVLPEFVGQRIGQDDGILRRHELVRLLQADSQHRVARAMVNRMWTHFFGAGFTPQVDDMGPHNPPSHPELLEFLTDAFVDSGYDIRRLMTWIARSDAWQRSSAAGHFPSSRRDSANDENSQSGETATSSPVMPGSKDVLDDPESGTVPLFSRVYPRHMSPEEVYDSIRVAIRSVGRQPVDSSIGTQHRRQWVQQFVASFGTDENDESLSFGGNISQALLLMNGADMETAVPLATRSLLQSARLTPADALREVSLAAVSRLPTEAEDRAFRARQRALARSLPGDQALATALEDMLWAYLNSSEFSAVY